MVISTPTIQLAVSIDNLADSGSRLFNTPITAEGAASSFDPLPPAALADVDTPVRTTFMSLAFDPHGGNGTTAPVSSITRLAFTDPDGNEIPVQNLSTPITFTLPLPPTLAKNKDDSHDACAFWDTAAKRYSTEGCISIPNPLPAGVTFDWNSASNISARGSRFLPLAWEMNGDLMKSCTQVRQTERD